MGLVSRAGAASSTQTPFENSIREVEASPQASHPHKAFVSRRVLTVFKLLLINAPTISSGANAVFIAGQQNSFTVTGTGLPVFSASGLPSWASLNSATGVISGTPPSATGVPYSITLTAINGAIPNATQDFTLSVEQAPAFSNTPLTASTSSGNTYDYFFQASGYPPPTFKLTGGMLPPGITLSASGELSGIPTQPGTYSGTVTATNSVSSSSQTFKITITAMVTDTPTMPGWDLVVFAALLLSVAGRGLLLDRPRA